MTPMDIFGDVGPYTFPKGSSITVLSELAGIDGSKKGIELKLMADGQPKAVVFFVWVSQWLVLLPTRKSWLTD